jgi:hypothetical protein
MHFQIGNITTAEEYAQAWYLYITRSKHESELLSEELLRGLGTHLRRQGYTQILLAQDLKLVLDLRN